MKINAGKIGVFGERLDKVLVDHLQNFSRSKIQNMIKKGFILVNDRKIKSSYVVSAKDEIQINNEEKIIKYKTENIKRDIPILYEDINYLILDKPCDLVVHPLDNGKYEDDSIINFILPKIKKNDFEGIRPGIVHRIDKDTSGILIVAKNKKSYEFLKEIFKKRKIEKRYFALLYGKFKLKEGIIEANIKRGVKSRNKMSISSEIDGKPAITQYKVLSEFQLGKDSFSFVDVQIKTGRTHQIRVHMASIGHFVLGDNVYGNKRINASLNKKFGLKRQFLHAYKVVFNDEFSKKEISVTSKLSPDLDKVFESFKSFTL
ncbi:MAG: RluA family pseudouridine synthase [Candidatus Gracilibacteria bacterium]